MIPPQSDHDLLIRIDEKVTLLIATIASKADRREVDEVRGEVTELRTNNGILESRVARHDRLIWVGAGVLAALQFILQFFPHGGSQ